MQKEQAYQLIKQRMFELDLLPGQFVTLREIAEKVGVPVGPVREAMQRLEGEGVVQILPQRGIYISPISVQLIRDAFGLRRILEAPGVRALAEHGDQREIEALLARTADVLERESLGTLDRIGGEAFAVDQRLHELAVAALRNEIVNGIYRVQQDRVRLIRLHVRIDTDREPGLNEHIPVLEALSARDADAAESALLEHIDNSEARAIASVLGHGNLAARVEAVGGRGGRT